MTNKDIHKKRDGSPLHDQRSLRDKAIECLNERTYARYARGMASGREEAIAKEVRELIDERIDKAFGVGAKGRNLGRDIVPFTDDEWDSIHKISHMGYDKDGNACYDANAMIAWIMKWKKVDQDMAMHVQASFKDLLKAGEKVPNYIFR